MKVTIVCDILGETNNGTTLAAKNLIAHLQEKGHDVTVVSPDKTTEGKPGYLVVPVANLGALPNKVLERNGVQLAKADEKILRSAIEGADVVHCLFPFPLACKAAKIAEELHKPLTASFHCQAENLTSHLGMINSHAANHIVYKVFYEKVYRRCHAVHYPTQFIRDLYEKNVRKKTAGVVISNGVNDLFFSETGAEKFPKYTIISTGRFCKEKSQKTLIKALAASPYKDKIHVIFAGSGPDENKLKRKAQRAGIDAEFRFFSREELVKKLRGADLYVHTSLIEIEAIACTEAIVCGLVPVICNSERSATKAFAADERCLYKKKSAKDLRKKITYFYEHPEARDLYREKYRDLAGSFRQSVCMDKMEQMLYAAIERAKNSETGGKNG